jgi:RimJ/RimL family protein N-acetyltransferase
MRKLTLVSVYEDRAISAVQLLFTLLQERTPAQSISHKAMPTFEQHVSFVMSRPYDDNWYLVHIEGVGAVGCVYLTPQREIGVSILRKHQGQGYGTRAVQELMDAFHGRQFLANINPANAASIAMFARLGFNHIQNTYAYE